MFHSILGPWNRWRGAGGLQLQMFMNMSHLFWGIDEICRPNHYTTWCPNRNCRGQSSSRQARMQGSCEEARENATWIVTLTMSLKFSLNRLHLNFNNRCKYHVVTLTVDYDIPDSKYYKSRCLKQAAAAAKRRQSPNGGTSEPSRKKSRFWIVHVCEFSAIQLCKGLCYRL